METVCAHGDDIKELKLDMKQVREKLFNGFGMRMNRIEIDVGEIREAVDVLEDKIVNEVRKALTPPPWWQKFLLKYVGTLIIVGTFVVSVFLLVRILPREFLLKAFEILVGVLLS